MFNNPLRLTLHSAMRASYQTLSIQEECRPFWIVSAVQSGCVVTAARGERFTAPAGSVMVHPPGVPFSESAAGPGIHDVLFLEASVEAGLALFQLYPVAPVVTLTAPPLWRETFDHLLAAQRVEHGGLTAFGLTAQLLGLIVEGWQAAGSVPRPHSLESPEDQWTRLVHFMTQHLGEKLGRDELAAQVHLHPGAFSRSFRAACGQTPMRMLRDLRLAEARRMLETTNETLETIAVRCGFEEAAYFSRVFHQRYGLPPGRHRSEIQNGVKSARTSYSGSLSPSL